MNELLHILLVEDNKMDVALTLHAFRDVKLPHTIQVVSNGEEAINYLLGKEQFTDRKTYPIPNIVLLDLNMPGMDGLGVLKIVKSTTIIKQIPIITLSPSKAEGERMQGYDLGASGYLVKPISYDKFLKIVKVLQISRLH